MGRRENAVVANTRQMEALALWLRAQRRRAALTYAAMAQSINYDFTASVLSRAAGGKSVPTLPVVEAFVRACQADAAEGRRLWKAARAAEHNRRRTGDFQDLAATIDQVFSHPKLIEDVRGLRRAMVHLRTLDGQPSLAELQRRARRTPDGKHRLPKSSLGAVLRGAAVPTRGHVVAFAEALGMSRRKVAEWGNAWDRVVGEVGSAPPIVPRPRTSAPYTGTGASPPSTIRSGARRHAHRRTRRHEPPAQVDPTAPPNFYDMTMKEEISIMPMYRKHPRQLLSLRFRLLRGPQPPLPPAGHTGSGLPIRAPRRYTPPPVAPGLVP